MELNYFDFNSSFNLLNVSFDKVSVDNYFNRKLIMTIAQLPATVYTSAGTPINTTYAEVSQPASTNWSSV